MRRKVPTEPLLAAQPKVQENLSANGQQHAKNINNEVHFLHLHIETSMCTL